MTTNQPKPAPLTAEQLAGVTEQLRNARERIEFEQDAPLDLDQATVIHDICMALDILPLAVLDEALNLIEPGRPTAPPVLELIDRDPRFLDELGRALQ